MDVREMPGLAHLPYAEVWFREVDETRWREASDHARELGKTGLEVWTTTETPGVAAFFAARGYDEVRRYVISEVDVAAASDPGQPAVPLATFAERPDLAEALYAVALEAYPDQPGRSETRLSPFEVWRTWGLDPHPPEAYFIALDGDDVLGYGYLAREDDAWTQGFVAVARAHRGKGVAGAIKRAQLHWAKSNGIPAIRTANEVRLEGMRDLNRRLGFRPLYDEIVLRGPVASESVLPAA